MLTFFLFFLKNYDVKKYTGFEVDVVQQYN